MRWRGRNEAGRPIEVGDLGPLPDGDTVLPSGERWRWLDLIDAPDVQAPDGAGESTQPSDLPWDGGRR